MTIEGGTSYQILIRGVVEEDEINSLSPLQLRRRGVEKTATVFTVRTDQSGLVGLIRHLHGQGYQLLAVSSEAEDEPRRHGEHEEEN